MDYAIKSGEKVVTTSFEYSHFPIGNYIAFKATAKSSNSRKAEVRQGIAAVSAARTLAAGKFPTEKGPRYRAYPDRAGDDLRRFGWTEKTVTNKDIRADVYDYLVEGGDPKDVLRVDGWNDFYDLDDVVSPTAIFFDYVQANIHDGAYDLKKLVDILRERDDVTFDTRGSGGYKYDTIEGYPEISAIFAMNTTRSRNYSVPFFWLPNAEQMKLFAENPSDRHRLVFEHDMLGLRAGGAAKYDTFYGYDEEDDEYDDD